MQLKTTNLLPNDKKVLQKKAQKLIPDTYSNYLNIFSKMEFNKLPKLKGAGNHSIYFQNNKS